MRNKLAIIILILMLTFQIVGAVNIPQRGLGIMPVDYVVDNTSNSTNLNNSQRIIYIEPENETFEQVPLQGEVVQLDDSEGYYVLLGDSKASENIVFVASNITSSSIIVGNPIFMQQTITITNNLNKSIDDSINLWDYTSQISETFLKEITAVKIFEGNELQSEELLFNINLEFNETKTFEVIYEYAPIQKTVICKEKSIIDLLPLGSVIRNTDLPLDTVISKSCTVSIYHSGISILEDVTIPIEEIDVDMITSVQHLQSGKNLQAHNNILTIPTI